MMTFIVPISTCCMLKSNGWKASTSIKKLKLPLPYGRQDIHLAVSRINFDSGGPSTNIKED